MSFNKPPNPLLPSNWDGDTLEQKMREGYNGIKQRCGCRMDLGRRRIMFRCEECQARLDKEKEEEQSSK